MIFEHQWSLPLDEIDESDQNLMNYIPMKL